MHGEEGSGIVGDMRLDTDSAALARRIKGDDAESVVGKLEGSFAFLAGGIPGKQRTARNYLTFMVKPRASPVGKTVFEGLCSSFFAMK